MPDRMSRITSARRRPPPGGRLALVLSSAVLLAILGMMVLGRRPQEPPPPPPTPFSSPQAPTETPAPTAAPGTPTPTPSPGWVRVEGSTFVEFSRPSPASSPTPRPRPTPSPAETRLSDCVVIESSSARQSTAAWGQILVEVEIANHCGRDLAPLEVWLEVAGYRDGAVARAVRGHPFEELWDGNSAEVIIGLPGSLDWYDRIEVRVLPRPE